MQQRKARTSPTGWRKVSQPWGCARHEDDCAYTPSKGDRDYGSAHPSPRDPAALLLSGQKWANHPCSVKGTLVTGLCWWKFIAETAKKTQIPLGSTLPGRKDIHPLLKLRFLLALLTGYITLTQSFRLTQGARNIPSAWKRKLIQHAHEKGLVVSKRPNIMRTIMPPGVQKKARSSKFLD